RASQFHDLAVLDGVATPAEVVLEFLRRFEVRDATMNDSPASSRALRFAAESMPASATTTVALTWWRCWKALVTGMSVLVSALLPSNTWRSSRNPSRATSRPT